MLFILNLTTIVTSGSSVVKHPNTTNESFDICPTDALQLLKRALLITLQQSAPKNSLKSKVVIAGQFLKTELRTTIFYTSL